MENQDWVLEPSKFLNKQQAASLLKYAKKRAELSLGYKYL